MRERLMSPEIDGFRYAVRQLGAKTGRKLSLEFGRALLPALAVAIPSLFRGLSRGDAKDIAKLKKLLDSDVKTALAEVDIGLLVDSLKEGLDTIFDNLPGHRVDEITELFSKHTDIYGPGFGDAGAPLDRNFDDHFAGRYGAMYRWLVFAARVNFADFFGESGGTPVPE